jgi:hypothetical protein
MLTFWAAVHNGQVLERTVAINVLQGDEVIESIEEVRERVRVAGRSSVLHMIGIPCCSSR